MSDFSIGGFRIPLPDFDGPDKPAPAAPAPAPAAAPAPSPAPPDPTLPRGRPGMHGPVEANVPISRNIPQDAQDAIMAFDKSQNPGRSYRNFQAWQAKDGSWIANLYTPLGGSRFTSPTPTDQATYRFKDGVTKQVGPEENAALDAEYKSRTNREILDKAKKDFTEIGRDFIRNLTNPPKDQPPGDLPPVSLHG